MFDTGVSIIIPAYNASSYIEGCVSNILSLGFPKLEIIIINDGSQDNTQELVERLIHQNSSRNVSIILINQVNEGVSVARNVGLSYASKEWIIFVDADDHLIPKMFHILAELPIGKADLYVFSHSQISSHNIKEVQVRCEDKISKIEYVAGDRNLLMKNAIGFTNPIEKLPIKLNSVWGKIYRKQFIDKYSIKFPVGVKNGEDLIFNLLCLENFERLEFYDIPIYFYYTNLASLTHRFKPDIQEITVGFFKNLAPIVERNPQLYIQYNSSIVNNYFLEMDHFLFHRENNMGFLAKYHYYQSVLYSFYYDIIREGNYIITDSFWIYFHVFIIRKKMAHLSFLLFEMKYLLKKIIKRYEC